ncbi:hypothetical protein D9M71_281850 [compost metagenome]
MAVDGEGALQGVEIAVDRGFVEEEAGHPVFDGVCQAAGAPGDRQRAEALGVHLAQAAGLEARGHQQEIAAGVDASGVGFVEADFHADTAGVAFPQLDHGPLQLRLALADHGDAAALGDDVLGHFTGQVDAFLLDQARDHGEQRTVVIVQLELLLHMLGVGALALPLMGAEAFPQVRVAARFPAFVYAIGDAAELALGDLALEHAFQPAAEVGGGDLLCVGLAHRGHMAGVGDAALEERQLAVELQGLVAQRLGRQGQLGAALQVADALVGQVVDGEHGGCAQAAPGHVGRGQGRRPVVGVDQFRAPADAGGAGGDLGGRQAQASEANMVVGPVVAMAVAVGCAFALVELGADQQIDDQPVRQIQAADPTRGQGGEAADLADDADRQAGFQHLPVTGDQHADVVA